jgi:hypothetical protein
LLAAAAVACVLLVACGREPSATDAVNATQHELAGIESAGLGLNLVAEAGADGNSTSQVGLELKGPFQRPISDGALPVARLVSSRWVGSNKTASTFTSTGSRAFVEADGKLVELQGSQLDGIRGTTKSDQVADLGGLHLSKWFKDRKESTTADTTTVTGTLDAPEAINDVFGLAGALGTGDSQQRLEGKDADRLRALVRSSNIELVTGATDHVLQSLTWNVTFAPGNEAEIKTLLPRMSGVVLRFRLTLSDVDQPVKVDPPA